MDLLSSVFIVIEPFRSTLLSMLRPFDIAKLLAATGCSLDPWEQQRHMDVVDDIVEDNRDITLLKRLGITMRLFGSDLGLLQQRLLDPCSYLARFADRDIFHIFVVATGLDMDRNTTFVREFRAKDEHHLEPEDMKTDELQKYFNPYISTGIIALSKWILCAPYLSGSLSNSIPGWFPVFNARPGINLRAYISTFAGRNSQILYMNRILTSRLFGYSDENEILMNLSTLKVTCITLNETKRETTELTGDLTLNYVRNILLAPPSGTRSRRMVVVNAIHPLNSAITLGLSEIKAMV